MLQHCNNIVASPNVYFRLAEHNNTGGNQVLILHLNAPRQKEFNFLFETECFFCWLIWNWIHKDHLRKKRNERKVIPISHNYLNEQFQWCLLIGKIFPLFSINCYSTLTTLLFEKLIKRKKLQLKLRIIQCVIIL